MRTMRIVTIVAAVGVLASSAVAVTFRQSYTGPVTLKFNSFDMGTVYAVPGGLVDGIAAVNAAPQGVYPAANGHYYDTNGLRDDAVGYDPVHREDGWGVLTLSQIYKSGFSASDPAGWLWLAGDGGKEITVLFNRLVDNAIAPSGSAGGELIQSQNARFMMYENPVGTFDPTLGSSGRTAMDAYTGVTGGTLILEGDVQPNVGAIAGSTGPDEFEASFKPDASLTTGSGTFASYIELDPTTAAAQRDYSQFNTDSISAWDYDFSVNGTTIPNDGSLAPVVADWTVLNEDPFRGRVIPEPLTMFSIGLASFAVGGYIRRRRQA